MISTTIHALIKKLEKEIANTISTQKILSKDFEAFTAIVTDSLNKHAPLKAKYLRVTFLTPLIRTRGVRNVPGA